MKVLFLDVDGVLNSTVYRQRWYAEHSGLAGAGGEDEQIDPATVARLGRILEATGAQMVLSSTWRILTPVGKMTRLLWAAGLPQQYRIHDKTPGGGGRRGPQIQAWLDANPETTTFVILDDESDMDHLMHRLHKTDHAVGLTDADVGQVISMLNGTDEDAAAAMEVAEVEAALQQNDEMNL